jgi:hypothetical protein
MCILNKVQGKETEAGAFITFIHSEVLWFEQLLELHDVSLARMCSPSVYHDKQGNDKCMFEADVACLFVCLLTAETFDILLALSVFPLCALFGL